MKCLYDRAGIVSEKQYLSSALVYPVSFLQNVTKTRPTVQQDQPAFHYTAVLPFVDGLSQSLRRCLQDHGIRTVFRSDTTLRKQLVRPKDPVPFDRKDSVIYKIPCDECDKVYIGETKRPVSERMKEHQRDVRLARTETSAVAEHAHKTGHSLNWNDVECLDQELFWHTRRVKEAIHIRLNPNNINRDCGIEIPEAWMPTIRLHHGALRSSQSRRR